VFLEFKRGVKEYKLWDSEDRKIVLSRDVTFDESSMLKSSSSQQVKSGQIKGRSQRVESDTSSLSPDSTVSFGGANCCDIVRASCTRRGRHR